MRQAHLFFLCDHLDSGYLCEEESPDQPTWSKATTAALQAGWNVPGDSRLSGGKHLCPQHRDQPS